MADPISILGTAVGVTSLVFQVVDECIKGYHFYCKVVEMPTECQYLIIRMQMEEQRFLTFSREAGLLWTDESLSDVLRVNQSLLLAILAEIQLLFQTTKNKLDKYIESQPDAAKSSAGEDLSLDIVDKLFLPDVLPEEISVDIPTHGKDKGFQHLRRWRDGAIRTARTFRTIILEPRRFKWVLVDQEATEAMIGRLAELNSFLIILLDESQKDRLRLVIDGSYRELILIKEDIQTLKGVLQALGPSQVSSTARDHHNVSKPSSINAMVERENKLLAVQQVYFRRLTETKIQYRQAASGISKKNLNITVHAMDSKAFIFDDKSKSFTTALYNERRVYIEWKSADGFSTKDVEVQMQLLADLICDQNLDGLDAFRCPRCLGYVRRSIPEDEDIFGLVFESQSKQLLGKGFTTLRDLLKGAAPSLSTRIDLCAIMAECLYQFHTVGWLHKGFCSQNIIFFEQSPTDLSSPFLFGFQLARPDMIDELSMKPLFDPFEDIYRHPQAQSSFGGSRYRKSYDLYSLALVFFEIIIWKPIEQIVGIDDLRSARPRDLQAVKTLLIEQDRYLQSIRRAAGDAVEDIVRWCLCADTAEKSLAKGGDDLSIEVRLQRTMGRHVVGRLKNMASLLAGTDQKGGPAIS